MSTTNKSIKMYFMYVSVCVFVGWCENMRAIIFLSDTWNLEAFVFGFYYLEIKQFLLDLSTLFGF